MLFVDQHVTSARRAQVARPERNCRSERATIQSRRPTSQRYAPARLTGGATDSQRHPAPICAGQPLTHLEVHPVPEWNRRLSAFALIAALVVLIGTVVYGVRVLRAWWDMP